MGTDWAHVASIVEDVLAREPHARATYLDVVCAGHSDLRRQVEALLASHHEEEALRASPRSAKFPGGAPADSTWTHARFERLDCLGSGGFGTVYRAYDQERAQWVALKLLRNADPDRLDGNVPVAVEI